MSNEKTGDTSSETKRTRTPRTYEDIERGALSLPLAQKVILRSALNDSIKQQVEEAKKIAEESEKIANG